ncbi:MAG TPA: flagellar hook-basal body complex protein FliE [Anaerolineaceae bacterium]|nr:flagellar hook-basal body complex protein FliE [Anaerolineaceae bacterium]
MEITPFTPISLPSIDGPTKTGSTQSPLENVTKTFDQVLNSLNDSQQNADNMLTQLASGGNVDVHQVMLATEENDVNFRVAMAIRDQLVNAYREVMRMAI